MLKAVIFDLGGVVFGSPIVGMNLYERSHNLPHNYLNAAVTATGPEGAFQRLERGELPLDEFYGQFGRELGSVESGNKAYREYCRRTGIECPTLPTELNIDGKELWELMMSQALEPTDEIVTAINHLRLSKRFKLAALTNNFVVPSSAPASPVKISPPPPPIPTIITTEALRISALEASVNPEAKGAPTYLLRGLFDVFVESAVVRMRKPDPRFYQYALDKLGVQAEEAVFLDDIGHNLVAARQLGIRTIRVHPGRALEAVKELEQVVGISLTAPLPCAPELRSKL